MQANKRFAFTTFELLLNVMIKLLACNFSKENGQKQDKGMLFSQQYGDLMVT